MIALQPNERSEDRISFTDFTQASVGTASGETYESRINAVWRQDEDPHTPYAP